MLSRRISIVLSILIFVFSSCHSQDKNNKEADTIPLQQELPVQTPNFNYTIDVPSGWTVRDTTLQDGVKYRLLFSPEELKADYPAGNILIASMNGRGIEDFTARNMKYLESNMPGIMILAKGHIDSSGYGGTWFTYTKDQNGIVRDMINYIIPLNGFAYMMTFGSNKGSIEKYRPVFDRIARSFRGYL